MKSRRYVVLAMVTWTAMASAQETKNPVLDDPAAKAPVTQALPNPLTLPEALRLADAPHPDTEIPAAELAQAEAQARSVEADRNAELYADIIPSYVDPADPIYGSAQGDSMALLSLRKRLYDFGRTRARERSLEETVAGRKLLLVDARQRRRLVVMQAFFDVLLADQRYMVDNEAMAHAYVVFDRIRERHKQGRVSDVDMAAAESHYQDLLIKRTRSQSEQQRSRQRLALALNRPGQLPENLAQPTINVGKRTVPDFDSLWKQVKEKNPVLLSLDRRLAAAREQVQFARAGRRPVLDAQLQAGAFERPLGNSNDWSASLNLRIPIYQGDRISSAVSEAQAELARLEAKRERSILKLRQNTLDLVQDLEVLDVRRKAAQVRGDYREMYLDRARALYEMEKEVSLGDAMTRMTEAQWMSMQVKFDLAMTWARIDALTGSLGTPATEEKKP
ncbi:MAG: TolC family protein [Acidiferrobacteraceae bacterium]|jgi:outer membrane protein TolC